MKKIFIGLFFVAISLNAVQLISPKYTLIEKSKECRGKLCSSVDFGADLTSIEWLDQMILARFQLGGGAEKKSVDEQIKAMQKDIKSWQKWTLGEKDALGFESKASVEFLYQRYDIAYFKESFYHYTGGANGTYSEGYFMADLGSKRILFLDSVVKDGGKELLAEKLLERYRADYGEFEEHFLPETNQLDYMLDGSFLLDEIGISFYYLPYHLAPRSTGVLKLTIRYDELKSVLKPEYKRH